MNDDLLSLTYKYYINGDIVIYSNNGQPEHKLTTIDRKKKRYFELNYQKYRLLSCAAIELIKQAKNKVIFLTLTFPNPINDETANKVLNRWLNSMRTNYGLRAYVGVLEHTQNDNPHYHILCEYPFSSIVNINNAFASAYTRVTNLSGSANMVRLPEDTPSVVSDVAGLVRYLCKYFTKQRGRQYTARNYFISRNIRKSIEPKQITAAQFVEFTDNLQNRKFYKLAFAAVHCFEAIEANKLARILFK